MGMQMVDWAYRILLEVPDVTVFWSGGGMKVQEGQTLTINEDGSSNVNFILPTHMNLTIFNAIN